MMLADGCESATRSRQPKTVDEIEETVDMIFNLRLKDGQLDNSGLTLNDLKAIRRTFINTLQAMYHARIAYKLPEHLGNGAPQLVSGIADYIEHAEEIEKSKPKPPIALTDKISKNPLEAPKTPTNPLPSIPTIPTIPSISPLTDTIADKQ